MNTEDHIPMPEEAMMPSAHEQLECRRAFVRRTIPAPDVDEAWSRFAASHARSSAMAEPADITDTAGRGSRIRLMMRWAAAACAVVAVLALGTYVVVTQERTRMVCKATNEPQHVTVRSGEGPEQVVKDEKDIVFRQTASASRTIKTITVSTTRGKDCHVTLPDGTQVWLDSESTLQFPETFTGKTRDVQLTGEAYFDVAHDSRHPMVVTSQYFSAVVLGTAFNMNVYDAECANIILVRGCVAVSKDPITDMKKGDTSKFTLLSPGEQAKVDGDAISIHKVEIYPLTQWKDGLFYFDSEPLADIMRKLGQWYNVNVVFENADLMNIRLHFVADRNGNLDDVIADLNRMRSATVTMKDNTVIVSKAE